MKPGVNLYDVLSKHFFDQKITSEEEQIIDQYKKDSPGEYAKLKQLFSEKDITIYDFDSKPALQKIINQYPDYESKFESSWTLYKPFIRIAASIVFLLGAFTGVYFYFDSLSQTDTKLVQVVGSKQSKVVLSDGSIVWLNHNAQLSYPDQFGDNREVELTGEAFFEIVRNPDKPFIVSTTNASVKVLGTSFNVNNRTTGTDVSVTTGTVQVQSNFSPDKVIIKAGYSATANEKEIVSYQTINQNYSSWRTGIFVFEKTSLKAIVQDLNTFYNNRIHLSSDLKQDCKITARFDNIPLKDVLEALKLSCNLSIKETKEGYTIQP